ncbi:hypothetical protein AAVH_35608, partial [Aphelenchoides avenae]
MWPFFEAALQRGRIRNGTAANSCRVGPKVRHPMRFRRGVPDTPTRDRPVAGGRKTLPPPRQ